MLKENRLEVTETVLFSFLGARARLPLTTTALAQLLLAAS